MQIEILIIFEKMSKPLKQNIKYDKTINHTFNENIGKIKLHVLSY